MLVNIFLNNHHGDSLCLQHTTLGANSPTTRPLSWYAAVERGIYLTYTEGQREKSGNSPLTLTVKSRWGRKGNMTISQEKWEEVFKQQWKTSSPLWREFSWKNVM